MSDTTASICAVTRSADTASNIVTPSVFCAVTAVIARRAVDAVRGEGLEVGLDACAGAGIASGDGQRGAHGESQLACAGPSMRRRGRRRTPERRHEAGGDGELDRVRQDERIETGRERGLHADRRAAGQSAREQPSHSHA